jgi:DNA repair exonuclease SbcCD ATPase subunit
MGKLSGIMDGMNTVRERLDEADTIKNDTSTYLNERFDESDKRMSENMKSVLKEQSEQAVFASAVNQTVLQTAQNSQVMLHNMINDLKLLEREMNKSTKEINKEVKGNLDGTKKDIQTQINKLSSDIAKIPTKHPEQVKTDLSGLDRAMMALGLQVDNIPTAKFPDMSGNFSKIEGKIADLQKKLSKRVHVFEIERDSNDLAKKITVRTK